MKAFFLLLFATIAFAADDPAPNPQVFTHRITGLFDKSREADLRQVLADVPGVELVSVDFEHGEGQFRYDPAIAFKGVKPESIWQSLGNRIAAASNHTFGIQPLFPTPHEQLTRVSIPIVLLDCRACCLGAYEILYRMDGVAQATATPHEVTVLIDPAKTDRTALVTMLKRRQVKLSLPEDAAVKVKE